jgi:CheY-like chemotaxis protein
VGRDVDEARDGGSATAAALVSEREQALAAGMNDFLTKPIDAPKLRRTLARHLRSEPGTAAADSA